ncbi:MAG: TIGR00725 family protein [Anaerolineales bacterium]|nr:TIGR00725 family protein [Anaerolineales bacterium]
MQNQYIGVIGSGDDVPEEVLQDAEEIGTLIAKAGAALVCGGRFGIMEAACRGAKATGGLTIGILPGLSREAGNPYVDVLIPTGLGYALRNFITVRSSDAIIMLHGEVGTLSEAVLAYQHGKPLVALRCSGGWARRLETTALENGAHLDSRGLMQIHYADNPSEAVRLALRLIGTVPEPSKI